MKKRSKKGTGRKKSKKIGNYDTFDRIAISAAVLMILVALALFYNLGTVGKAITAPSPPVDLTKQESESLDLSSYNKMNITIRLSGDSEVSKFTLNAEKDNGQAYYQLVKGEKVLAYGILSADLGSSGNIYLNDDEIEDLELTLQGNLLTLTNLNFIQPDVAKFDVYDEEFNLIEDDVLEMVLDEETSFYLNITSTSLPEVSVMIDLESVEVEEVDSGSDFITVKLTFSEVEEKPYSLEVAVDVGGKETTKRFILAVNGFVYESVEEGYAVLLKKEDGDYKTVYELKKTSKLQPISLLCGELVITENQQLAKSVEKILSYQKGAEQWKENAPSEFDKLEKGRGYLFDLNGSLSFTVECGDKPLPQTSILTPGWNLLGTNGYKATKVVDLKASDGEIAGIYEYGDSQSLSLDELASGKVYWIKVE